MKTSSSLSPIAIFAFNRPDHLRNLFESLEKNKEAISSEAYIFVDSYRTDKEKNQVKKVIRIAQNNQKIFKTLSVIVRDKNLGCKKNIIDGVTEVLNKHQDIIVLEDDIVVGKFFLRYMNSAVKKYKDSKNIFHISSFSEFDDNDKTLSYFSRGMNCWGWATWRDKWHNLSWDTNYLIKKIKQKGRRSFDFDDSAEFFNQLVDNQEKIIDTWAIYWYASIYLNEGLCLNPSKAISINTGNDGSGQRAGLQEINTRLYNGLISIFPDVIEEDQDYFKLLKKIYKKRKGPFKGVLKKILNFLPIYLKKYLFKLYDKISRLKKQA